MISEETMAIIKRPKNRRSRHISPQLPRKRNVPPKIRCKHYTPPKIRPKRHIHPKRRRPGLLRDIPLALSPSDVNLDPLGPEALLMRVWEKARSVKPPDPLDIAHFLEVFDSQPAIIQRLFAYNQRKPIRYRGQWILGELLYYFRRKEWKELIGAFDTYFFRAGVPANLDEYKSRGRVTAVAVQQRLFPSSYHTSLVWMAHVEILQKARPVEDLFKELVEQVTASKTRNYERLGPSLVSTSSEMFSAVHFTPFLVAAYRKRKYKRLVTTFHEMSRLGIEPRVEQISLLAGALAGLARGNEATSSVDRIEGLLKEPGAIGSRRPLRDLPRDVALYLPALRRFLDRKCASRAALVGRRIVGCGYVTGTNPSVDELLAKAGIPTSAGN
jgi:hypothetical protein